MKESEEKEKSVEDSVEEIVSDEDSFNSEVFVKDDSEDDEWDEDGNDDDDDYFAKNKPGPKQKRGRKPKNSSPKKIVVKSGTGKRGRPRKYPVIENTRNVPDQNETQEEKTEKNESGKNEESPMKKVKKD